MCGFFGVVGTFNDNLDKPLISIKHRGPDDWGYYHTDDVRLGFRRLSIIDLSPKGHQPMSNSEKSVWIIFNGEIYNYLDLRKKLLSKYRFKSKTDTEVIIHGYEEWGIDGLLKRMNGMFAFCLFDKQKNIVYLVRDRIGKKPLYYFDGSNYLAFSSEVKAFFKLQGFKKEIDEEILKIWMGFPYLPDNNKTILKGVYKIPPASYLRIKNRAFEIKKYWYLPEPQEDAKAVSLKELESLLIDSVQRRLIADVPVGVLLSGGLDSSLIAALASTYSRKKINTINIAFPGSTIDESFFANKVSQHLGTNHISLKLDVKDIYEEFQKKIGIYDDLSTTDSGLFSTYILSKAIRQQGVKVALVGEGADEIFGGYSWFGLSQLPFKVLPSIVKSAAYYYAIMRQFSVKSLSYITFLNRKLNESSGSFLKKMQWFEIVYSLPNHYCMKVDKGSMAASLEARAPYMDYRVVEMARNLSMEQMLGGSTYSGSRPNEKFILRSIAEKYLPLEIVKRKKLGGMFPVYTFLNQGIKEEKKLILKNIYLEPYFPKKFLSDLIKSSPGLDILRWYREWILWKTLLFSLWARNYRFL